jgi:hypothetical protein
VKVVPSLPSIETMPPRALVRLSNDLLTILREYKVLRRPPKIWSGGMSGYHGQIYSCQLFPSVRPTPEITEEANKERLPTLKLFVARIVIFMAANHGPESRRSNGLE